MNYNETVAKVMALLKEKEVCLSSRKSHRDCYESLELYSSTETTRIYAVPSVEMMRKAMESGNMSTDEKPLWSDDEAEMARIFGLR